MEISAKKIPLNKKMSDGWVQSPEVNPAKLAWPKQRIWNGEIFKIRSWKKLYKGNIKTYGGFQIWISIKQKGKVCFEEGILK